MNGVPITEFDHGARPGEIRIFGDCPRPFTALVAEDMGLSGFRLVPVSTRAAPMSAREMTAGGRVFQLWNVCTAPKNFAARSWIVDTLSGRELSAVLAAIPSSRPGCLTAGDGRQARYERENLVPGGAMLASADGSPLAWCRHAAGSGVSVSGSAADESSVRAVFMRFCRIAACFAVCIGMFYVLIGPGRDNLRILRASAVIAHAGAEDARVELLDNDVDSEAGADDHSTDNIDVLSGFSLLTDIGLTVDDCVPRKQTYGRAGSLVHLCEIPSIRAHPGGGVLRIADGAAEFSDPRIVPLVMMECIGAPAAASSSGSGGGTRADAADMSRCMSVECIEAACPWNVGASLLAVRMTGDGDVRVELFFNRESVGGYRELARAVSGEVVFEVIPVPGGSLDGDYCQVTLRREVSGRPIRERCPLRRADSLEDSGVILQTPAESGGGAAGPSDDVPVDAGI